MLLEQILAFENLQQAWKRVKQNKGAAGVDGLSVDHYLDGAKAHWGNVHQGLERGYYCPLPVKRVVVLNLMVASACWEFRASMTESFSKPSHKSCNLSLILTFQSIAMAFVPFGLHIML
jgi:hypothetical protein